MGKIKGIVGGSKNILRGSAGGRRFRGLLLGGSYAEGRQPRRGWASLDCRGLGAWSGSWKEAYSSGHREPGNGWW